MQYDSERFLDHARVDRRLSHNTVQAYRADLADFEEHLGAALVRAKAPDLSGYFRTLSMRGAALATIERRRSTLRSFYTWADREGLVRDNPARSLRAARPTRMLPATVSSAQVGELVSATGASTPRAMRDRAILELLYGCGLRASELIGLTISRVDFSAATLRVMGKGSVERIVPLGPSTLRTLDRYAMLGRPALAGRRRCPALFLNASGGPLCRAGLWRMVRERGRAAGIPDLYPHRLRHACATHMIQRGADLYSVKTLLGHSSVASTQIYLQATPDWVAQTHKRYHPRG